MKQLNKKIHPFFAAFFLIICKFPAGIHILSRQFQEWALITELPRPDTIQRQVFYSTDQLDCTPRLFTGTLNVPAITDNEITRNHNLERFLLLHCLIMKVFCTARIIWYQISTPNSMVWLIWTVGLYFYHAGSAIIRHTKMNILRGKPVDEIKKTIYLTRGRNCMGDDATAPNLVKYV